MLLPKALLNSSVNCGPGRSQNCRLSESELSIAGLSEMSMQMAPRAPDWMAVDDHQKHSDTGLRTIMDSMLIRSRLSEL